MRSVDTERRIFGVITLRILPFIMLLYLVAFLDRVNVGFAALTMNKDLGFSPATFGFGASIFFIGYFIAEIPSNIVLIKMGARKWIASLMIAWGCVSAAMVLVRSPVEFYILRFLLGVAEAGFFPGMIFYLSSWFPAKRRATVMAIFLTSVPISTALGSPLSALLLRQTGLGLVGWQWLFLLEALPAVCLGIIVLFVLADGPETAQWLRGPDRVWLIGVLHAEAKAIPINPPWHGISGFRVLLLSVVYFGLSASLYVISVWSPQIIQSVGTPLWQIGLLNSVPALITIPIMLIWAANSDRTKDRIWHAFTACVIAALGLICVARAGSTISVMLAMTLAFAGISSAKAPLWGLPAQFSSGSTAGVSIATINSIGNLGGFCGPFLIGWAKSKTGRYDVGLHVTAFMLLFSALAVILFARTHRMGPQPEPGR